MYGMSVPNESRTSDFDPARDLVVVRKIPAGAGKVLVENTVFAWKDDPSITEDQVKALYEAGYIRHGKPITGSTEAQKKILADRVTRAKRKAEREAKEREEERERERVKRRIGSFGSVR